ncbi:MAG: phosphoenolpyruvate--protein phosphotransferase [Candidatus Omnitrophica bacterium]|nr:phosphoenolpyruvate--protein phosphotransferase [Candidatus Omnitrophota bacterium]
MQRQRCRTWRGSLAKKSRQEIVLKGIPAAPGIAMGPAFLLDRQDFIVPERLILDEEAPIEIARFEEAVIHTKSEIEDIRAKIATEVGSTDAQIFDAHLLVLEDCMLIEEVIRRIKTEKKSAEYIFSEVLKRYIEIFENIQDEYIKERSSDVADIGRRVLKHLMGESRTHDFENLAVDLVIIAHDISPSDAVSMYNKKIMGFLTDIGGRTAHTAIIAKSLGVPAVVGLKDATLRISNQDFVIVDGRKGVVIVNPTDETRSLYSKEKVRLAEVDGANLNLKDSPAETPDGRRVNLMANFELYSELTGIKKYAAEGIGLYRTEFFYMNRLDLPSEEEQYQAYRKIAEEMKPNPVIIRTLDLGGDKFLSSLQLPKEMMPFLGSRAIRLCLEEQEIFKTQLRAILRASAHGNVGMMYPMIAGPGELRAANGILKGVKQRLRDKGVSFNENMPVGVMIEVPAAAMTADLLAKEVSFFSIGTNDLIQYTLAVDRANEKMAQFYEPGHPAVLRLIRRTISAAHDAGIKVSVCGEMASDPTLAVILLGLGVDSFSMSPASIFSIKRAMRSVRYQDAQEMARHALRLSTGQEVDEFMNAELKRLVPDFYAYGSQI